ncbi:FAD-binding oxidoreductase [Tychonema sp. LEGE 07199]|uniref:NAD(P)/FAD-dependent oxidoreductase n=1 Tax=unclassified Tychonema TaxID=2642144 RepID=UPI0018801C66|nr:MULTISPECIES: FAD-dependent oxidoreductase [unclassified Tychonema]MBE9120572.1 FAD-binding oxidoreductase [Tychonema sp. LEGE 07199]MBE9131600.1 FAD-binding oxidoreductase [Tychonema sp. LEGE 07196]
MVRVAIIGCGIIGASIAFELSKFPEVKVTVFDKQPPALGSTGAALGVLMGVISHKTKGRNWQLRESSLQRYETLIPELEAVTGRKIPFNKQGILMLGGEGEDLSKWEKLAAIRESQGWKLELWDVQQVRDRNPHLSVNNNIIAGIYSPQDRQVDPTALTLALVDAAERNGVIFEFGVEVEGAAIAASGEFDRLIISAGLGSATVTASLNQLIDIRPVLGQALHLRLKNPLGNPDFRPVITCDDVHIVPLANQEFWIGATVEFPENGGEIQANADMLEEVMARAISLFPALAEAEILRKWSGLRPRPEKRPAPIIETLPGNSHVLIASGHYRNGVLLAPATARSIREAILQ